MSTTSHSTPTPESDEHVVREALDSAMAHTRPPHDLPAAALARGRRLRTRRRVGIAGSAVAASVLAAVALPWAFGGDSTRPVDGSGLVATQGAAPEEQAPPGWWDMPAAEMVSTVEAILPDGITVTAPGPLEADTPEGGPATGWINAELMGSTGQGRLNVMVYRDARPVPDPDDADPDHADPDHADPDHADPDDATMAPTPSSDPSVAGGDGAEPDRTRCGEELTGQTECAEIRDEDGAVIGRRLTHRSGALVVTEVVIERDGGIVYAASANTLDEKWDADSPVTATRPPLPLDQLEALVRNDAWVSYEP